jgi:hypothetical protein
MNDWSRLAVDLNEKQKLGAEKTDCANTKYAPDKRRTGHVLSGSVKLTTPVGRRGEDNSVCPSQIPIEDNSVFP